MTKRIGGCMPPAWRYPNVPPDWTCPNCGSVFQAVRAGEWMTGSWRTCPDVYEPKPDIAPLPPLPARLTLCASVLLEHTYDEDCRRFCCADDTGGWNWEDRVPDGTTLLEAWLHHLLEVERTHEHDAEAAAVAEP